MSKNYKTFKKEKWLYFTLAIVAYFLPFVIVTACLLPMVKAATGVRIALGLGVVIINAIPFLMGVFKSFFAHFPMLNMLALVFLALGAFFTFDVFRNYSDVFLWIELAAAVGSIASCILWVQHRKYTRYSESVKATIASGAFSRAEVNDD